MLQRSVSSCNEQLYGIQVIIYDGVNIILALSAVRCTAVHKNVKGF